MPEKELPRTVSRPVFNTYTLTVCALLTALSELNPPRYMTPGGIFDAYREKKVVIWNRADVPVADENIGLAGSPTRVAKSFPKTVKAPGMKIEEGVEEPVQFVLDASEKVLRDR